jgi:FADH2 O2-dependent halogenase
MNSRHFQIVVVGSGFGGSLISMIARRLGFSVALIERGRHPRFAIGESSTPLANLLLEELASEYDLPFLLPFCKWGSWQEKNSHIACGLKRGFTFYYHKLGHPFRCETARDRQLLVGASPEDRIADTHWYRPDFDHYLAQQAEKSGVVYWDETELVSAKEELDAIRFNGKHQNRSFELTADFVIDASGPRGFLHRALHLPEGSLDGFPATQALFSHFAGVAPLPDDFGAGNPPYPVEHAAVHHVFDGGWIWVLKFNNGLTSAGVAAREAIAQKFNFRSGESAWRNLLRELPSLGESFNQARPVYPFVWQPRIAFQSAVVTGQRWALLPSAAGVVDPLLSTGFPLTLLGIQRLGRLLKIYGQSAFKTGLEDYARQTTSELETTARLVKALYARMNQFDSFRELTLLYFAAASFSEAARRLGKTHLAQDFLLCGNSAFAAQLRQLCQADAHDIQKRVQAAIEPFDVAGLTDRSRHPWYPACTSDLFANRRKLDATEEEISAMLKRCGFSGATEAFPHGQLESPSRLSECPQS